MGVHTSYGEFVLILSFEVEQDLHIGDDALIKLSSQGPDVVTSAYHAFEARFVHGGDSRRRRGFGRQRERGLGLIPDDH